MSQWLRRAARSRLAISAKPSPPRAALTGAGLYVLRWGGGAGHTDRQRETLKHERALAQLVLQQPPHYAAVAAQATCIEGGLASALASGLVR
ncbi:hypothetical protein [Bordetella avium]|uniref:hypothetical protein n=1 Tax=Bordetella avium TaxID=521 RepID=UPI000FD86316|nr:hypothetical protein [Bordetella avium]WQE33115.1 hypothetical protein U0029_14650 [Bordetella avium]